MGSSNGLGWALSMFGLDLVELLALLEVLFADPERNPALATNEFVRMYFVFAVVSFAFQFLGILLVAFKLFRLGGIIQIVSSALHVPKGEGLIGVIGGIKAYRYADTVAVPGPATASGGAA